jgi:predicted naringenin-chalcone synthase
MVATVIGIGTALPGTALETEAFIAHAKRFNCQTARQERVLEELYRRTNISRRCSVLAGPDYGQDAQEMFVPPEHADDAGPGTERRMLCYEKETVPLAMAAANRALSDAQIEPDQVTHLVTISCTGFFAPGFDVELIKQLPLRPTIERTHVGFMGCHGAMNGLRVARMIVEADPKHVVLLCTTEICSLHFQYGWSTDKLLANSLFSDGAAALILSSDFNVVSPEGIICGGNDDGWRVLGSGSFIVPDTAEHIMWRIGDHGFYMHLDNKVPDVVEQWLPQFVREWLQGFDLTISDIAAWDVHPGGPRILESVEDCLKLPPGSLDASRAILAECGNMSSPTVLFILERLRALGKRGPTVVLGFGPGLTIEAALLA